MHTLTLRGNVLNRKRFEVKIHVDALMYQIGEAIEARFGGKAKYYGGKITNINGDGSYQISYDDGDTEMAVNEVFIRKIVNKIGVPGATTPSSLQPVAFQKDSKVEARFGGKAKYYGATVVSVNEDGTYDLHYDDGDSEKGVKAELIRAIASTENPQSERAARDASELAITTTVGEPTVEATVLMSTGAYDVGADQTLPVVGAAMDDDGVDLYGADDASQVQKSSSALPLADHPYEPEATEATQGLPKTTPAMEGDATEAGKVEEEAKKPADPAKELREATAARLARRTARLEGLSESALTAKATSLRASSLDTGNDSDGSDGGSSGNRDAANHPRKSYFRPPGEGEGAALAAAAHARASWGALSPSLPRRAAVRDLLPPVFLAAFDGAINDWKRLVRDHEGHHDHRRSGSRSENSGALGLLCLTDGEGRGPLHYAALCGKVSFIRCALASARAELDAKLDHQLAALRSKVRNAVHRAWDNTMENERGGDANNTMPTSSSKSKQVGFAATTVTTLRASAVDPSPSRTSPFDANESSRRHRLSPGVEAVAFLDWACSEADRLGRLSELECEGAWHRLVAARDSLGRTPLFYAASGGNHGARAGACLEALLDANPLRADFRARSPGLVAPPPTYRRPQADFKQWHALVSTPEDLVAKSGQWFHQLFQRRTTGGGASVEASESTLSAALQMMDHEDNTPPKVSGCLPVRLFPARHRFFVDDGRLEGGALLASGSAAEREIAALTRDLTSKAACTSNGNHDHLNMSSMGLDDEMLDGGHDIHASSSDSGHNSYSYSRYAEDSAAALLPSDNVVCGWAQRTLCLTAGRLARASGSSRYAVLRRAFTSESSGAASTHCLSVPELSRVLTHKLNFSLSLDALETLAWRFRWRSAKGKALQVDVEPLIEFVLQAAPSRESGSDNDDGYSDGSSSSGSGSAGGAYSDDDSRSEYGRRNNSGRWGESKECGGEGKDNGKENQRQHRNGRRKPSKRTARVKSRKPPPPIPKQEPEPARLSTTFMNHTGREDLLEHSTWPLWPPKVSGATDAATIIALRVAVVDGGDATGGFSAMHGMLRFFLVCVSLGCFTFLTSSLHWSMFLIFLACTLYT